MSVTPPLRPRSGPLVAAALLAGLGSVPTPALAAPSYPWCAKFATTAGECSFYSREQCMETLSGIGGFCQQNPGYSGGSASESTGTAGGPYNYVPRSHRRRR